MRADFHEYPAVNILRHGEIISVQKPKYVGEINLDKQNVWNIKCHSRILNNKMPLSPIKHTEPGEG